MDIANIGIVLILLSSVIALLPESPFQLAIAAIDATPFLQYLAWLIPVGEIIAIAQLWLVAISAYYGAIILARWIKLIGN